MTPDLIAAVVAFVAVLGAELMRVAAFGIAFSNADDLAFDLLHLATRLRPSPAPHPDPEPAAFAILVPAWREADVIGPMLRRLLRTVAYDDYAVFVGVYANDPATAAEVFRVADPRVRCVRVGRPGPTTKADCLNQLWRAASLHAAPGIR